MVYHVAYKILETSILHVNKNNFTGPLIIGAFEKQAPGKKGGKNKPTLELLRSEGTGRNFQPAEKFDRTLLSYGIVQYFLLCSHGSLNDLAMKFSPG